MAQIPAANIYITLTVCTPGALPNATYTAITQSLQACCVNASTCPFHRWGPERLAGLPETHSHRGQSWAGNPSAGPRGGAGGREAGPQQEPYRGRAGGGTALRSRARGRRGAPPPARRGPRLLALSPRGQALQGKQKSVVNTVPNPKWLLPSCNPIKVRLVYLSSSGLFITEQMAATFGRLRRPPPAAHSSAQQNLGLHLCGAESGGHRARGVPCPRPAHTPPPPRSWWPMARVAAPPAPCKQQRPHTGWGAPRDSGGQLLPGAQRKQRGAPAGEPRAVCGHRAPRARCQAARNKGAPWGATGDAGGRVKARKMQGKDGATQPPSAGVCGSGGGHPGVRSCPRPLQPHPRLGLWRRGGTRGCPWTPLSL